MDIYEQLKRDEGDEEFPYTDSVGKITIGVGFNLTDRGCPAQIRAAWLTLNVSEVEAELQSRLPYYQTLDQVRQAVLINMAYNLGIGGLETFTTFLSYVAKSDWDSAAGAMLDSKWAKQVGDRATRLSEQISTGEWR